MWFSMRHCQSLQRRSVAVTAVRANPAGLITSAVASYLLGKGIEYISGQFMTRPPPVGIGTCGGSGLPGGSGFVGGSNESLASCKARLQTALQTVYPNDGPYSVVSGPNPYLGWLHKGCTNSGCAWNVGTWTQTGTQQSTPVPATESSWDAARTGYWSDPAIYDLVKAGVPLPTDKAAFSPPYKDMDIGDPTVDPVTGKRYQDKARVTPSPSDPSVAEVQTFKQEVDSAGNPVVIKYAGAGRPGE